MEDVELRDDESQDDIIDIELSHLLDSLLDPEDAEDDEAFEEAADIFYDVIADLEDAGEIQRLEDIPEDASEEDKKKWLEDSLPKIKEALQDKLESIEAESIEDPQEDE